MFSQLSENVDVDATCGRISSMANKSGVRVDVDPGLIPA